jgi:hypothetical protein
MHDIACFGFSPYPGSELHTQLIAAGKINKYDGSFVRKISESITNAPSSTISWTDNFSTLEVRSHIWIMSLLFYTAQFLFRPYRIVASTIRIYKKQTLTTFEIVLANFIAQNKKRFISR